MSDRKRQETKEGAHKAPSVSHKKKRPVRRLAALDRLRGHGRQER